jgi:hypothetical protein
VEVNQVADQLIDGVLHSAMVALAINRHGLRQVAFTDQRKDTVAF